MHLVRALVGVEGFRIGEETPHVVFGRDAVAAQQLSGPRDCLAALGRGERLGERRMGVGQLAFGLQLSRANNHALRSRYVGEHFGEKVLYELERADWSSKLQALLGIFDRILVGAHRASGSFPRNEIARHFQNARGVAE